MSADVETTYEGLPAWVHFYLLVIPSASTFVGGLFVLCAFPFDGSLEAKILPIFWAIGTSLLWVANLRTVIKVIDSPSGIVLETYVRTIELKRDEVLDVRSLYNSRTKNFYLKTKKGTFVVCGLIENIGKFSSYPWFADSLLPSKGN